MAVVPETELTVGGRDGQPLLYLDPDTGLPVAVAGRSERRQPIAVAATLRTGGDEVYLPPHDLGYLDTVDLDRFTVVPGSLRRRVDGPADVYTITAEADGWTLRWEYTLRSRSPRLAIAVELTPAAGAAAATLRDLRLTFDVRVPDLGTWCVEAPGNELRPGLSAAALEEEELAISTAGGVRGSTGLVVLHRDEHTVVVWPLCRTEVGDVRVRSLPEALRVDVRTGLAGHLEETEALRYEAVHLDVLDASWPQVRDQVPSWYPGLGIATPGDRPDWIAPASIFEVQIGYSVFAGDYRYGPYPDARALLDDLPRIHELGYDVLQIMPRQPYPSYNVHDYADITTTYGDEAVLREVVATCHRHGMKVILDILLHGVIDMEVMAQTADRVRRGPYFERLAEGSTQFWGSGAAAVDARDIAWSRHILDFEQYWSDGSPARHPLAERHPEWFLRDSAGEVIGIYTKAFDVANASWQEYFCAAAEQLVRRLDVDGFRFDAPTYTALPNWSPTTRRRASYSPLGCLELFGKLRPRLRKLNDSIMLYTEPSGLLFRQTMDITYNYDEQWLIPAVLGARTGVRACGVRDAADLAAWFRDRDAVLPEGSVIAHHIDSHDTFWWPLPGEKWRREQYGLDATRALLAVFALGGGAYMTFVGGEAGIEPDVRRVHRLRREHPEIRRGVTDYAAVEVDDRAVYAVVRRSGRRCSVVLVNLSATPVDTGCSIDAERLGLGEGRWCCGTSGTTPATDGCGGRRRGWSVPGGARR
ncbi:MAG: DUF3459 domain-containing protein [Streptosporangiales bacterium]|nr:DUF3459 domain-containing protein [Streptosporangiales bacterium]